MSAKGQRSYPEDTMAMQAIEQLLANHNRVMISFSMHGEIQFLPTGCLISTPVNNDIPKLLIKAAILDPIKKNWEGK